MRQRPEALFVCVHNAGRSQMAAALLDHYAEGRVDVRSAGTAPAEEINPAVVQAMAEVGIDISKEFPKPLTDEVVRDADSVITGVQRRMPGLPGQAISRLGPARPGRQDPGGDPADPRRD